MPTRPEAITGFAKTHLQPTDQVALEATTNCWAVAELLQGNVANVVISNPLLTKAIATAKVKTEEIVARVLRHLPPGQLPVLHPGTLYNHSPFLRHG